MEGIANVGVAEINADGEEEGNINNNAEMLVEEKLKQLQNSVAGLITRNLPAVEAFFIVNASSASEENELGTMTDQPDDDCQVVQFAASNKTFLNVLLRSHPQLLEKGLRAMQANRSHGSF